MLTWLHKSGTGVKPSPLLVDRASVFGSGWRKYANSGRITREVVLLAVLALVSVGCLRYHVESPLFFAIETLAIAALALLRTFKILNGTSAWAALTLTPIVAAYAARFGGSPIAYEMMILTTLGASALAMAFGAARTRAMSMVASGFLTLFSVSISDDRDAVILGIAWIAVCVWHLVANHWEKLDLCAVDNVRRSVSIRPLTVLLAIGICILSGLVVRNFVSGSNRFSFGIMPTSGGSDWSDSAARGGVGTGEAAVAARERADSFGAVDSKVFLEATGSTLFDMANDMLGQPTLRVESEKRQALANQNISDVHQHTATSEKSGSGGSFATSRTEPRNHQHLRDATQPAVLQWIGPSGIRLALQRYDSFDGIDWFQSADLHRDQMTTVVIQKETWFFDPVLATQALSADKVSVGTLKFLRLESNRIPSPMITAGLHVKDVDRADLFGIERDGTMFMPDRVKVPPLTIIHLASLPMMEDELWELLPKRQVTRQSDPSDIPMLDQYVTAWTEGCTHPYEKLQAIVERLRSDFELDRSIGSDSADPIGEFLRTKRGGQHLFATTAALMSRKIGLESRLATGFYVQPSIIKASAGQLDILAQDVHVWVEVKLEQDRWFEVEACPGYREPIYKPSLLLTAKQLAVAYWPHGLTIVLGLVALYYSRLFWFEQIVRILWNSSWLLSPKRQLRTVMWIVESRARLTNQRRPKGRPQRDWLLEISKSCSDASGAIRQFCDAADQETFGGGTAIPRGLMNEVVGMLTTSVLGKSKVGNLN